MLIGVIQRKGEMIMRGKGLCSCMDKILGFSSQIKELEVEIVYVL